MIYRDHEILASFPSTETWDIDETGMMTEPLRSDALDVQLYWVDDGEEFSTLDEAKSYVNKLSPTTPEIKAELEELRQALRDENISQGELARLEELKDYIEFGDVELLEPAGVPEGVNN